ATHWIFGLPALLLFLGAWWTDVSSSSVTVAATESSGSVKSRERIAMCDVAYLCFISVDILLPGDLVAAFVARLTGSKDLMATFSGPFVMIPMVTVLGAAYAVAIALACVQWREWPLLVMAGMTVAALPVAIACTDENLLPEWVGNVLGIVYLVVVNALGL